MSNPGNTGHRYKMATIVSAEIEGDHVHTVLSCGHSHDARPMWSNLQDFLQIVQKGIGKRTRCTECKPAKEAKA